MIAIKALPVRAFSFDVRTQRYRSKLTGRFVSSRQIRSGLERVIETSSRQMQNASQSLVEGRITLGEWRQAMAKAIKTNQIASYALSRGGTRDLTQSDFGRMGAQIKRQYAFLDNFAREIEDGRQALDGRLVHRSRLYAQVARHTYENTRRSLSGKSEERRVLNAAESCPDCIAYAARGWQPIGTLPVIGDSRCKMNCRCTFEYR